MTDVVGRTCAGFFASVALALTISGGDIGPTLWVALSGAIVFFALGNTGLSALPLLAIALLAWSIAFGDGGLAYPTYLAAAIIAGASVGVMLTRHGAYSLAFWSGVVAVVEWPLILAQFRNPALVFERVSSGASSVGPKLGDGAQMLRPVGNTVSPGLVGIFLLFGLASAALAWRRGARRDVCAALVTGHVAALLLCGSRASLAVLFLLGIFVYVRLHRWLAMLLAVVAFVSMGLTSSTAYATADSRALILRTAWPLLQDNWVFGVGWGATPRFVSTVADGRVYHLHVLPLHVLFEGGLVGLFSLACVTLCIWKWCRQVIVITLPLWLLDAGVFIEPRTVVLTAAFLIIVGVHIREATAEVSPHDRPADTDKESEAAVARSH